MIVIKNYTEFEAFLGKELGISGWHTVTLQQQIDQPSLMLLSTINGYTRIPKELKGKARLRRPSHTVI